ncbi:MAG: IS200/IS605 family transposase [Prolixibacteraceae bacterium]|nr:IS200/IS605 family transposase [Prolixibacteraceae bacterium]
MSEHITKRHNKTLLLYHIVCPLKYRKSVITKEIGESLKEICLQISERYEIHFVEIGYESDHVHLLVQSVPKLSVSEIARTIKSITAKQLFQRHPEIEAKLWGGNFWTSGYYANTVGQYANEEVIRKYVESQGKEKEYKRVFVQQLTLF